MRYATQLIDYCKKNNLFTNGDANQYNNVITLYTAGYPFRDLACMIWICSDNPEFTTVRIEKDLESL